MFRDVMQALSLMGAAVWIIFIIFAQTTCSAIPWIGPHGCNGVGWALPFVTAPFGIPALVGSIFVIYSIRKKSRNPS
jgi:hypothetical protein